MTPEDNPADDRYQLDQCIKEIKRLQDEVAALKTKPDWRIGAAVKPKIGSHHWKRGQWAIVRAVDGNDLILECNDRQGRFTEPANDWMTA